MSAPQVPQATPKRFAWGVAFQTFGRIGHTGATFFTLWLLTQILEPDGVGLFASFLFLFALLDVAVDAGSSMALLRRSSAQPGRLQKELRLALRFRTWSIWIAGAVALLYFALEPRAAVDEWALLCVFLMFSHLPATYGVVYHLRLQFGFPSGARFAGSALSVLAVLLCAGLEVRDPTVFLCATLFGRAIGHLAIYWGARSLLRDYEPSKESFETNENSQFSESYHRESLTLGLGGFIREAYGRLDLLLLRWLVSPETAGIYAPASRALNLSLLFPSYMLSVAMPDMAANAHANSPATQGISREFVRKSGRLARNLFLFATVAALISLPLAPWFLGSLFGTDYQSATDALRVMAAAAVLAYAAGVFVTALIACGEAHASMWLSSLALIVNLGANLILIPVWGMTGAACARVLCEAVILAGTGAWLRYRQA